MYVLFFVGTMTGRNKCLAIVKGKECRRVARSSLLGACCDAHKSVVINYIPAEAGRYASIIKEAKKDASGILKEEADDLRAVLLKTLMNRIRADAAEKVLETTEQFVEAFEQSKAEREKIEGSERFRIVDQKKRLLLQE